MTQAKQLTDRFWQLFEDGKLEALDDLIDPDCHFKMPGNDLRGRAALKQMLGAYRTAFPDLKHQVKSHVESGDTIAIELEVTATHTGPMQTPAGTVPATGKKVVWESCDYIRVKNGRFLSWHVYHDSVPFLTALGLLPAR
jgi:ketosteroid isomerase-like protein